MIIKHKEDIYKIISKINSDSEISLEQVLKVLEKAKLKLIKHNVKGISESDKEILVNLLDYNFNKKRIEIEFDSKFSKKIEQGTFQTEIKPLGILLHIAAGNVFLGAVDSIIMGLITLNKNIVKLPSNEAANGIKLFKALLDEADDKEVLKNRLTLLEFKGGSKEIENALKETVDGIVVWGSEEAVNAYRENLNSSTKLIEFGSRISSAAISKIHKKDLESVAEKIVRDVSTWNQSACASPQTIFTLNYSDNEIQEFNEHIGKAFIAFEDKSPRPELDKDEYAEILKFIETKKLEIIRNEISHYSGKGWNFISQKVDSDDAKNSFELSPLNRFLIVKHLKNENDVILALKPYAKYLQTFGVYGTFSSEFNDKLFNVGVTKITNVGSMLTGEVGSPHEGAFILPRFTKLVEEEGDLHLRLLKNVLTESKENVPFYKNKIGDSLEQTKITTKEDFYKFPVSTSKQMLNRHYAKEPSIVFGSGGTTGNPKYLIYLQSEMDDITKRLGDYFLKGDLKSSDRVGNIFLAGNLWSSFIAIDRAMKQVGCFVAPIGGNFDIDLAIKYIEDLKINSLIGLPSTILALAEGVIARKKKLKIEKIFYGGEHIGGEELLEKAFTLKFIRSAGYACVESGVIGYQCPHNKGKEHHVAMDSQHIEILNLDNDKKVNDGEIGEIVVTNLRRKLMPIIRYRTGDLGRIINKKCKCGSPEPIFELLGRADDIVNVGGLRLNYNEVYKIVSDKIEFKGALQFKIEKFKAKDKLTIIIENDSVKKINEKVLSLLTLASKDLKEALNDKKLILVVKSLKFGSIERIKRTGKIKRIDDKR